MWEQSKLPRGKFSLGASFAAFKTSPMRRDCGCMCVRCMYVQRDGSQSQGQCLPSSCQLWPSLASVTLSKAHATPDTDSLPPGAALNPWAPPGEGSVNHEVLQEHKGVLPSHFQGELKSGQLSLKAATHLPRALRSSDGKANALSLSLPTEDPNNVIFEFVF